MFSNAYIENNMDSGSVKKENSLPSWDILEKKRNKKYELMKKKQFGSKIYLTVHVPFLNQRLFHLL